MDYRAEVIFRFKKGGDESVDLIPEGSDVLVFTAGCEKAARGLFTDFIRERLKSKPKDVCFLAHLYRGDTLVHSIDACASADTLSPEERRVVDMFFDYKKEHPDPVPYDEMTPLQRRMQSGGG